MKVWPKKLSCMDKSSDRKMFEDVKRFAVRTGIGRSRVSAINAVDDAMVDASVGELNFIKVTSILPEGIERTDEISKKRGCFRPAVLSTATVSEPDREIAAGIAWGTREDGKGGYVIEHSTEAEKIDVKDYRKKLEKKLNAMADRREVRLKKKEFAFEKMKLKENTFGCVLAALVYLL